MHYNCNYSSMKLSELIEQISTVDGARNFLQQRRHIPTCTTCSRPMSKIKCTTSSDGVIYRCPNSQRSQNICTRRQFLAGHHVSLTDFILLAYFWAHESRITSVSEMLGLHENTVIQWFSYFRDVCSNYLIYILSRLAVSTALWK